MPHFSAIEAVKIALVVLAVLGTGRLIALSYPDNPVSQAYLLLY
jgi:hypothetical protein